MLSVTFSSRNTFLKILLFLPELFIKTGINRPEISGIDDVYPQPMKKMPQPFSTNFRLRTFFDGLRQ